MMDSKSLTDQRKESSPQTLHSLLFSTKNEASQCSTNQENPANNLQSTDAGCSSKIIPDVTNSYPTKMTACFKRK